MHWNNFSFVCDPLDLYIHGGKSNELSITSVLISKTFRRSSFTAAEEASARKKERRRALREFSTVWLLSPCQVAGRGTCACAFVLVLVHMCLCSVIHILLCKTAALSDLHGWVFSPKFNFWKSLSPNCFRGTSDLNLSESLMIKGQTPSWLLLFYTPNVCVNACVIIYLNNLQPTWNLWKRSKLRCKIAFLQKVFQIWNTPNERRHVKYCIWFPVCMLSSFSNAGQPV